METAAPAANGLVAPTTAVATEPVQAVAAEQGAGNQAAAPAVAADAASGQTALVQDAAAGAAATPSEAAVPDPLPEPYTSLFKQAKEAPTDFTTWTSLISAAEKLADIGRLRQVYDAFLAEYPLCYGYWKKYADAEAKYVSLEDATRVYDRGVAAVPYSVDLWGHYAMHKQKAGAPVEDVEKLFERGLAYVGMDYLSHGLWDKYLAYELSLGAHAHIGQLYSRLLRMPIQKLDEYRARFHEYAAAHSATELVPEPERAAIAERLAQQIREERAAQEAAAAAAQASAASAAQAAANTGAAQAMDTTAAGDDAVDAVAQQAVAGAGSMAAAPAAPAAAAAADSTAADAPAAAPTVLSVAAPDDIAASLMAGAASGALGNAPSIPTATAPTTAPPPIETSFPASAPAAAAALAPPQEAPVAQLSAADTDMPQATIPQSDGPADDPMEGLEAAALSPAAAATAAAQDPIAAPAPIGAASAASTAPSIVPDAPSLPGSSAVSAEPAPQAAALDLAAQEPAASQAAAPVTAEPEISDEQIKAAWLSSVDEVYSVTKEEWARRKPFEEAIKRPYFHVKPLDLPQLQNWSKYLDYIEEKKDIGMIIRLYERCLVACASYPDFWMRYVRWQEASSKAAAQVALERATSVHCKRRPEIQLFAARFHERHGNIDTSRALFRLVTQRLAPTLISGAVQHANFERRQGNKAGACAVYDKFLEREASKEPATYVFVVIQYINALQQGFQDVSKAREVYTAALEKVADSLTLWEGIIHFEETLPGSATDTLTRVLEIYNRAVQPPSADSAKPDTAAASTAAVADAATNGLAADSAAAAEPAAAAAPQGLSTSDRELLSNRAIDLVDMHGDATLLSQVEKQHAHRFKLPGKVATTPASRKRGAEAVDSTANKAAKTAAAATPAASAAYPAAAALPGPPAAGPPQGSAAMSQAYYSSAAPYYQYPQAYPTAQQPYAYPAASAAGAASAYQYAGYYG